MIERIRSILAEIPEVSAWKLTVSEKQSSELFYVGRKLETNRATDTTNYVLTIYVDKEAGTAGSADTGRTRGSAAFSIYAFMSDDELRAKIRDNVYAAGFAMNPWYDIPGPEDTALPESNSNIKDIGLKEAAETVSDAVFKADAYADGSLSATEIFIDKTRLHIYNSKGVDLQSVSYGASIELIPSWEKDGEEVEVYQMLRFESIDPDEITRLTDEQLQIAAARFTAKPLSELVDITAPLKVILQDKEAGRIFGYFANDLDYSTKYQKANKFEPGDHVQGDNVTGTPLTLRMVPYVRNAFNSAFFDGDGVILKDTVLVQNGVAVNRKGAYRFGYYLGEKAPAGSLPILVVEPGTKSFREMAAEPYLRCQVFSGIQVEPNTGYFGGEVRLGYYFDGEKEIPVTGFSISGNMNVSRGTMVYSSETVTTNAYHGPKYLEIPDMKLA